MRRNSDRDWEAQALLGNLPGFCSAEGGGAPCLVRVLYRIKKKPI